MFICIKTEINDVIKTEINDVIKTEINDVIKTEINDIIKVSSTMSLRLINYVIVPDQTVTVSGICVCEVLPVER